jgi:hypothetical protein
MSAPTTLTISYISQYTSGLPSQQATATYTIPAVNGTPIDYTLAVKNLVESGGVWTVNAAGVNQFIPWSEIFGITAQ